MKPINAAEKLKVLKSIIERLNTKMTVITNEIGESKLVFIKNNFSERKYSLIEKKLDFLLHSYN